MNPNERPAGRPTPNRPEQTGTMDLWIRAGNRGERTTARLHDRIRPTLEQELRGSQFPPDFGAEDLINMTLMDLLAYAGPQASGNPHALARSICRNKLTSLMRKVHRLRSGGGRVSSLDEGSEPMQIADPDSCTPDLIAARVERRELIEARLAALDPEDARVLRWREEDGLSSAEIGKRLGIADGSARARVSRARDRRKALLRDLVGDWFDDEAQA